MVLRKKSTALWITIIASSCGPEPEEANTDTNLSSTIFDVTARPCRSDIFFFEKPSWAQPFDATYANNLRNLIQPLVNNNWFDANPALLGPVQVQVWPVLPARAGYWRQDGHRRFFRLVFVSPNLGRVKVKQERLCEVVALFQALKTQLFASDPSPADTRIGRECDATAMGLGRFTTIEGRTWQWDRLGVSSTPPDINETSAVRVALIDSGVRPDLAPTLGVDIGASFTSGQIGTNNAAAYHAHGTFMATYIRHLAPDVDVRSYRAIDEQGVVTSGSLGHAIDTAIYDTTNPLIINLSLGFPPELSRRAQLSTRQNGVQICTTTEDGISEVLRYVLYLSRQLDSPSRPISTFSAAGNRAVPIIDGPLFHSTGVQASPCGTEAIPLGVQANFFPAALDDLDTCRKYPGLPTLTDPRSVTTAVGAVDSLDERSGFAIVPAEPAIVAPGEYVFASRRGLPADETNLHCNANIGPNEAFEFPAPLTGSSVSTALVSAAAASAQATLIRNGESPLRSDALARLLYLTGDPTCRDRADGTPIRRLSMHRMHQALRQCSKLVACAIAGDFDRPITKNTLDDCKAELDECLLVDECPNHEPVNTWDCDIPGRLTCQPGVSNCILTTPGCVTDCSSDFSCDAGDLVAAEGSDPYSLGSGGPQPRIPSCPDCALFNKVDPGTVFDLVAGLNPSDDGGLFSDPELAIYDEQKNEILRLELLEFTEISEWSPGQTVVIPQIDVADYCPDATCVMQVEETFALGGGSIFLEMVVDTPINGGHGRDYSLIKINRE